jgi:eukaryotic-like serine/threonine-protein kinase
MNQIRANTPQDGSGRTLTVLAESSVPEATPARGCIALVPGSGPQPSYELHCLLRRRLRIAGLIAGVGTAFFLARNFLLSGAADGPTSLDLAIHSFFTAILAVLLAFLWSSYPATTASLRICELVLFGVGAMFFTYLQYRMFGHGALLEGVDAEHVGRVLTLGANTNAMRWLILIVLYGTFIPNTWKRCTVVVAMLVAIPLLASFAMSFRCPIMGPHTWTALFDPAVVLGVGAAIAIFGSYKISTLQAEAFAARRLGQYVLRKKLGSGGMGEVYLGEHTLLRRACAIKVIRPDQAGDPTNLGRFEREVRAMATLTHWNTVEVYDYGRADDGTFYYVMEYLPGMSLQELVEKHGPVPPARTIHFLRQVCAGLKEAHSIGLIHRDIKPSNVLVCERGGMHDVIKLLDFGLVKNIGPMAAPTNETVQGSILGSPPYMSPEQAMSKPTVDVRTDIYSLGGLAYYLLTGQAPFVRDSAMEHLVAHLHEPVVPPRQLRPEIPEDLDEIIIRCLQKKPEDRYPDIMSVDRALAASEAAGAWDADQADQWWREQEKADERPIELVV